MTHAISTSPRVTLTITLMTAHMSLDPDTNRLRRHGRWRWSDDECSLILTSILPDCCYYALINGENWQPSLCLFSAFCKICTVKLPKVSMSSLRSSTDDAQRGGGESVIAIRWLWSLHSSARPEITPDNHQLLFKWSFLRGFVPYALQ